LHSFRKLYDTINDRFGKATIQLPTKKITVEVKSLNSKGLDLNVKCLLFTAKWNWVYGLKLPPLGRGKVDFFIESTAEQTTTKVNVPIVKAYINQLKVYADADQTELMKMAVRMPDAEN
jgi:uncharacterized protein YicC (UPF0701 family)